jgi:hypothetical protein
MKNVLKILAIMSVVFLAGCPKTEVVPAAVDASVSQDASKAVDAAVPSKTADSAVK